MVAVLEREGEGRGGKEREKGGERRVGQGRTGRETPQLGTLY